MAVSSHSRGNIPIPLPPVDPYLRWHAATGFEYLPDDRSKLPLTLRLADGKATESLTEVLRRATGKHVFEFPSNQGEGRYLTLILTLNRMAALLGDAQWAGKVEQILAGQPLHASLNSVDLNGWPTPKPLPPKPVGTSNASNGNAERPKVVIAVIDDGIAFAHHRFWDEGGRTRVRAFWDQDSQYWLSGPYIDYSITQHRSGSVVDEDALYASEGLNNYAKDEHKRVGRRIAHGTHVLDLAAALPLGSTSSERAIIAVQLPRQVTSDPSGTGLAPQIDLALKFINARMAEFADKGGKQPPLVVNISYGMTGGPQDGTHQIEERIDEFIKLREAANHRTEVVIAAGNVRLERGHAKLAINANPSPLLWRLQPDDRSPSALEIWVPANEKIQVQVKGPTDQNFGAWVKEGGEYPTPYSTAPCMIDYKAQPTSSGRRLILIRTLPTAPLEPLTPTPIAPSGVWTIQIQSDGNTGFCVDAYVQRDDTPLGYKRLGRQSYFEDMKYSKLDEVTGGPVAWDHDQRTASETIRVGTLNAIATGPLPFVVGGYRRADETSSRYSSLGASSTSPCPRIATVSDDSTALHGVIAAGTRSGSSSAMNGTSVAAPQLTRWIADEFAADASISSPALRMKLTVAAKPALNVPANVRRQAVGDGLLELPQVTTLKTAGAVRR